MNEEDFKKYKTLIEDYIYQYIPWCKVEVRRVIEFDCLKIRFSGCYLGKDFRCLNSIPIVELTHELYPEDYIIHRLQDFMHRLYDFVFTIKKDGGE